MVSVTSSSLSSRELMAHLTALLTFRLSYFSKSQILGFDGWRTDLLSHTDIRWRKRQKQLQHLLLHQNLGQHPVKFGQKKKFVLVGKLFGEGMDLR